MTPRPIPHATRLHAGCQLAALVISLSVVVGCSTTDGPPRYAVSGTVSFDGKPVPKGFITFEPDAAQGNSGPQGAAAIVDGKFVTGPESGVVGGPHLVKIVGYDGVPTTMEGESIPDGQPLFTPYQTTIDIPKARHQQDFVVPKPGT